MTMLIGGQPGRIYTDTEAAQGKISPGQKLVVVDPTDGSTKEYVSCVVGASQNLTSGMVVSIGGGTAATQFTVVVAPVAAGPTARNRLGVVITPASTTTASASSYVWVQVWGRCNVLASVSINPNVSLKVGTTAGQLTARGTGVTASAWTQGIVFLSTTTTAGVVWPAFLTYPSFASGAD